MAYPWYLSGWLADVVYAADYHWTPLQIIECEQRYPGAIDDAFTILWARGLIKQQLDDDSDSS